MPGLHIDKVGDGDNITNNNITYAAPVSSVQELDNLPDDAKKDEQRRFVRTVNNYYYYNSSVNDWFPVEEPVYSPSKPKIYGDDVRDLQELQAIPEKDLTPDEHRYVELEGGYFIYKGDTNVWEKVQPKTEVPFQPKQEGHPPGQKDQLYFIKEHGTNKVIPDYLLKRGIIVQTQREFDVASSAGINLEEVFRRWGTFSHGKGDLTGPASPPNFPSVNDEGGDGNTLTSADFYNQTHWGYDKENDRIYLNKNWNPYTGFISPREFAYYTFETTFSSPNNDDDHMTLIIGFWIDPKTGYEHTLSVERTLVQSSGQGDWTYRVVHNFTQITEEVIVDATELAPYPNGGSGGWGNNGPTRVSVVRAGDTFQIKTSQFGSTEIDDATLINLDLADYPQLEGFTVASRVGFGARSQKDAYFSDVYFTGLTDYIFWPQPGYYDTYEWNQDLEEFILQDPQTVFCKDYFGMNRFVDSYMFKKKYYITERDEIICFQGDEGESWDADNAISKGSDLKPFLHNSKVFSAISENQFGVHPAINTFDNLVEYLITGDIANPEPNPDPNPDPNPEPNPDPNPELQLNNISETGFDYQII